MASSGRKTCCAALRPTNAYANKHTMPPNCILLLCAIAIVATCPVDATLNLPEDADALCLGPGNFAGAAAPFPELCDADNFAGERSQYGLAGGQCVTCGSLFGGGAPCPFASTVAYVSRDFGVRYCACNVGYYTGTPGRQAANDCIQCPRGKTTDGYAADRLTDCYLCDVGYTASFIDGTLSNCTLCSSLFRGPVTTIGAGFDNPCVCPAGYTGQPGNCTACPGLGTGATTAFPGSQTCVCPAGGTPPFCKPCTKGVVIKGKCECPAGVTGVWPNCKACPSFSFYPQTTFVAGSNIPCKCSLAPQFNVTPVSRFLDRDLRTGKCGCRIRDGYFLKVVPPLNYNPRLPQDGPCATKFDPQGSGHKQVVLNGLPRLGCDPVKGLGVNVASQGDLPNAGNPYCIKCSSFSSTVLDKVTTRCNCKTGFGHNPYFRQYPKSSYCLKCTGPKLKLGRIQYYTGSTDSFCRCNWEGGYYGIPETTGCTLCPDTKLMKVVASIEAPGGACQCAEGYKLVVDSKKKPLRCALLPKCKAGEVRGLFGNPNCRCPVVKESDGSCVYPAYGCNKMNITIWSSVTPAQAAIPFARVLESRRPAADIKLSYTEMNATANLADLAKLSNKKNVAIRVDGCFCTRIRPAYRIIEVTAAGQAILYLDTNGNTGGDLLAGGVITAINVNSPRTQKGYYGQYHKTFSNKEGTCLQFRTYYYSGNRDAVLRVRSVLFPFDFSLE